MPQDPQGSAEQIRTYGADDRFVAVYLPVAGLRPLWGDRMYDPIYEAAEEMGLPVMLHSVGIIHPTFPFNLEQTSSPAWFATPSTMSSPSWPTCSP